MNFNKKAQGTMAMPFGMIFAIFLIVVFIIIAFTVGKSFLNLGQCSSVGLFYEDLQRDIDSLWHSQSGEDSFVIKLPKGIEQICFADLSAPINDRGDEYYEIEVYDLESSNLFLIPASKACDMGHKYIEHINLSEIIKDENPNCIPVEQDLKLKKGFYDRSVIIG